MISDWGWQFEQGLTGPLPDIYLDKVKVVLLVFPALDMERP